MKIFIHEFICGEGLVDEEAPSSLLAEGYAMLRAIVADFARLGEHHIIVSQDFRLDFGALPAHETVLVPQGGFDYVFSSLVEENDAVFLIAPETDGVLARLTEQVEKSGKILLGPSSQAVQVAADKMATYLLLHQADLPTPETVIVDPTNLWKDGVRDLGFPLIMKPVDGVGCEGIFLASQQEEIEAILKKIRDSEHGPGHPLRRYILQRYIEGEHASVSLLCDGREVLPLSLNHQEMKIGLQLQYLGGTVPLEHPLAERAFGHARRACSLIPGLRGYVGMDFVLTDKEAFLVEINPRLTTSYLALRRLTNLNLAGAILGAVCLGRLPQKINLRGSASFSVKDLLAEVLAHGQRKEQDRNDGRDRGR
ncbi:MAG: Carbamoyl-phosphate synthase large chain [Actinobacteria bacterium]|uniref:Tyramine---L-glutamate ligase n=2 Tax=Candidatus Hakubella thermalkaliphila TaxID=2754717 RepID=A0A6V8PA09_9ACTN|nr:ATP-grasp domain-containing protein [Candidatus Hakubella thermalkaliphila]MBT9171436.1 Carbamoyl-phosphate synthase large chain [Actinomycetota bacterium]GFP27771.1 tyramine---L-glutamate ligase [Candidatus Hakubella thermalkaliphila]